MTSTPTRRSSVTRASVRARTAALRAERVPFVHAQVVMAERPTSAKPGDEAIIYADGTIEGFVGGSCAESTVRAQSLALLDSGDPLLLRITPTPTSRRVPRALRDAGPRLGRARRPPGHGVRAQPVPVRRDVSRSSSNPWCPPRCSSYMVRARSPRPSWRWGRTWAGTSSARRRPTTPSAPAGPRPSSWPRTGATRRTCSWPRCAAGTPYVGLVASQKRGRAVLDSLDVDEDGTGPGPQPGRARHRGPNPGGGRAVDPRRGRRAPSAPQRARDRARPGPHRRQHPGPGDRPGVRHVGRHGRHVAAPRPRRDPVVVLRQRVPARVRRRPVGLPAGTVSRSRPLTTAHQTRHRDPAQRPSRTSCPTWRP